jgi:hypothetical protein
MIDAWLHPAYVITHDEQNVGLLFRSLGAPSRTKKALWPFVDECYRAADGKQYQ